MGIAFFTSIAASFSIFLFLLWYLRSKNQMEVRVRSLGQQQRLVVEYQDPFTQRVAFPLVDNLVNIILAILPTSLIARCRRWLVTAGDKYTISQFLALFLVSATLFPGVAFMLVWVGSNGDPSLLAWLLVAPLFVIGALGPILVLRRRALNRQKRIWRAMPNAIDLLTTCVEAGLSLDLALQRVAERYKGPLSDEIKRTLREVGLGKPRRDALADMATRVDLPDLMTFVNSIVQAEAMGTSVGGVLRAQAVQMRMRRRQRAEQVARQAPIKMVFPMVFCFIPALFIITIGPVALNAIDVLRD